MSIIRLIHALPNAWLPSPGQYLRTKGVNITEVKEALNSSLQEYVVSKGG